MDSVITHVTTQMDHTIVPVMKDFSYLKIKKDAKVSCKLTNIGLRGLEMF